MVKYFYLLFTSCFLFVAQIQCQENHLNKWNDGNPEYNLIKKLQKNNIRFKENKGQVKDQYWNPRNDILYYTSDNNLQVFLKKNGFHYQLSQVQSWKTPDYDSDSELKIPDKIRSYRLDIQWLNTNPNKKISSLHAYSDVDNYYNVAHGMPPALEVKSYQSIKYEQIYKGIDLEFHGKNGYLEYDFIVQPGADYKQIQIQIDGAKIYTTKSGELILKTPLGDIHEGALKVFQDNQLIASQWVLNDNILTLNIPCYDKNKPLIIDPPIRVWGTYYGGSDDDYLQQMIKINNNLYFCGYTYSNSEIATSGTFDNTYSSNQDMMIVAFSVDGYRIWGSYGGDNGNDIARGLCKGENDNVIYIVGQTTSNSGIATSGTHQTSKALGIDGFIFKMNASNGTRTWGTYYGGNDDDIIRKCVYDPNNNALYLTGSTKSSTGIATLLTYQTLFGGDEDAFISRFNVDGTRNWGSYYGSLNQEVAMAICLDDEGYIYFAGRASGLSVLATALQLTYGGGPQDGILAKFNSSGGREWGGVLRWKW